MKGIFRAVILLLIAIMVVSGCSKFTIPDIVISVEQPESVETMDSSELPIIPISNLRVEQMGSDALLQWDGEASMFKVYRAWAYPDREGSYQLLGVTDSNEYLVEEAYWSGLHYYAVEPVGGNLSGYVMYLPKR